MFYKRSLRNEKGSALLEYGLVATLLCSVALPSLAKVGGVSVLLGTKSNLEEVKEREALEKSIKNEQGLGSLALRPHEELIIPKNARKKFTFYIIQSDNSHTTIVFNENNSGVWERENEKKKRSS